MGIRTLMPLLAVVAVAVAGCGGEETKAPKAANEGQMDLKPLPNPGSPGGDKQATPGGGNTSQ